MKEHDYYVYMLTNFNNNVLYTGVTNDLVRRVAEHREGIIPGFSKYAKCRKLVYYEHFRDIFCAIEREKQIKGGSRLNKIVLIESVNPLWNDLWYKICG